MVMSKILLMTALALITILAIAQDRPASPDPFAQTFTELAPGVWLGARADVNQIPVMGNTVFVIGDDGVIVFDGGGAPLMSERVLAKIRDLTDKPVTHVITSHWHIDHSRGIGVFVDAFPKVQIIAHPFTREFIIADLENRRTRTPTIIPGFRKSAEEMFASNTDPEGHPLSAQDREWYAEALEHAGLIDHEYQRAVTPLPNLTFDNTLVIYSGSREIQLHHYGRGNTGGDVFLWLPQERILATGDLVVSPIPYGIGSYPREWAAVLRKINDLPYETLVPGHGAVQHDTRYVEDLIEVLDYVADTVAEQVAAGVSQEGLLAGMNFSPFEGRFAGSDTFLQARFKDYFEQPIVEAAFLLETGEQPETKPLPFNPDK